jgi:hypothetical protein
VADSVVGWGEYRANALGVTDAQAELDTHAMPGGRVASAILTGRANLPSEQSQSVGSAVLTNPAADEIGICA